MYIFFSVLIIIVSILLVLIVLVQNSKGGGLAAGFSSSNQYMGVRKTADFLEKATWTLAGALLVLCLLTTVTINHGDKAPKSAIEDQINNTSENSNNMGFPTTAPTSGGKETKKTEPAKDKPQKP
jgi:preprotein translocase subunit SecG